MKPYLELSDIFQEKSLDDRMIELASRFKAYRKKAGLTQVQLSDRSGVSYGTVKRFERTGKISMDSLWMLSMAIGCDDQLDALFSAPMLTADDLRG
ncbi:MAG: helix-turn-helix transcriptional regulator [Candidatus Methanomethylophilaceae archaeon]|nr:helix-turn-helix transcriptional regulator [Candidatus Methanomethylophilaceae archaeon]